MSVHRLNAKEQLEEQLEDLTSQRKDLWEFRVSCDVPSKFHSSQGFTVSVNGLVPTPAQAQHPERDPDTSLPVAFGPTTGHFSPPLISMPNILLLAVVDFLFSQSGPWEP